MKGFDSNGFARAGFEPRTEKIEIKEFSSFFPEDEKPIFKVRGLTADEVARTNDAAKTNKIAESLLTALTTMNEQDIVSALKEQLGYGEEVNSDIQRRIELIIYGSVEPKLPRELIVKMGEVYPTAFYSLSNKITELTGLGQVMGKQKPSGETQESKQV